MLGHKIQKMADSYKRFAMFTSAVSVPGANLKKSLKILESCSTHAYVRFLGYRPTLAPIFSPLYINAVVDSSLSRLTTFYRVLGYVRARNSVLGWLCIEISKVGPAKKKKSGFLTHGGWLWKKQTNIT